MIVDSLRLCARNWPRSWR